MWDVCCVAAVQLLLKIVGFQHWSVEVCCCKGCDCCCVFCLYYDELSCRCSMYKCFFVQMLHVRVLCVSCGSYQCCMAYLQCVNAGRGCKRRPY